MGEKCSFHSGCHQQDGRFEPTDQCPGQVHRSSVTLLSSSSSCFHSCLHSLPSPVPSFVLPLPSMYMYFLPEPELSPDFMLCDCQLPFWLRHWGVFSSLAAQGGCPNTVSIVDLLLFFFPRFLLFLFLLFFFFPFMRKQNRVVGKDTSSDSANLAFNLVLPLVIISSWEIKLAHCAILSHLKMGELFLMTTWTEWVVIVSMEWGS